MPITLEEATRTIKTRAFRLAHGTSKVNEFVSTSNGRVLYLRTDQGFPDHADIAIHPEVEAGLILTIPGVLPNKRVNFRFGSNMPKFPRRLNGGVRPEHFGRALYVYTAAALAAVCRAYG